MSFIKKSNGLNFNLENKNMQYQHGTMEDAFSGMEADAFTFSAGRSGLLSDQDHYYPSQFGLPIPAEQGQGEQEAGAADTDKFSMDTHGNPADAELCSEHHFQQEQEQKISSANATDVLYVACMSKQQQTVTPSASFAVGDKSSSSSTNTNGGASASSGIWHPRRLLNPADPRDAGDISRVDPWYANLLKVPEHRKNMELAMSELKKLEMFQEQMDSSADPCLGEYKINTREGKRRKLLLYRIWRLNLTREQRAALGPRMLANTLQILNANTRSWGGKPRREFPGVRDIMDFLLSGLDKNKVAVIADAADAADAASQKEEGGAEFDFKDNPRYVASRAALAQSITKERAQEAQEGGATETKRVPYGTYTSQRASIPPQVMAHVLGDQTITVSDYDIGSADMGRMDRICMLREFVYKVSVPWN